MPNRDTPKRYSIIVHASETLKEMQEINHPLCTHFFSKVAVYPRCAADTQENSLAGASWLVLYVVSDKKLKSKINAELTKTIKPWSRVNFDTLYHPGTVDEGLKAAIASLLETDPETPICLAALRESKILNIKRLHRIFGDVKLHAISRIIVHDMIKPDTIAISWFTKLPPLDREVSKNILLFPVSHRERLMSAQDLITITDSVVAGSGKIGVIVTKNHAWIVKFFFKRNEPTDAAKQLKDTLKKICTAIDDKENKNSFVFVQLKRHESRAGTRESITTEIQADICEYDGDIKDVFIEEAHKCSRAHPSARICAATDGTLISKEKIKGIIPQLHAIAQFAPGPSRYGAYQTRWILATDIDLQLAARFHEHQMRCAQKQWDYISEWLKYNPISFHNSHSYSRTAPEIGAGVVEAGGRMSYPELEIQAAKAQQQLHLHNHLTVEAISMAPEIPAVMLTQAFTEDVTRRYMFERYA